MVNLTSVHVTDGIPDSGTGTVSTIDQLIEVGLPISAPLPAGANILGAVTQSGPWTVSAAQSGSWNVGITGTVPLPTGASTSALQSSIITALGSPFQVGGSIGNTSFGISGTLPAFAAIPAFKIDQTTPGTTNAVQVTNFPGTQPISGTIAATQSGTWNVGLSAGTNAIGSITNTSFGISGTLPAFAATPTVNIGTAPTIAVTGTFWQATQPISGAAVTPVVSTVVESSHVLKASAGQVQGCYAVNTSAVSGFLILLNATSAPADGAVTPLAVMSIPPFGVATLSGSPLNPIAFSTGIVAVLSSASTPFTKTTTGGLQGFISGQVI